MEAGKSKFEQLMEKKLKVVSEPTTPVKVVEYEVRNEKKEIKNETMEEKAKTNENVVANDNISTLVEESSANSKDDDDLLKNPKIEAFVKSIIKTVNDSSDLRILKRHPAYKGERVKRSFVLKLEHDNWLNQIYNIKRIEKTKVLEDALEMYLNKEFHDCKPK